MPPLTDEAPGGTRNPLTASMIRRKKQMNREQGGNNHELDTLLELPEVVPSLYGTL